MKLGKGWQPSFGSGYKLVLPLMKSVSRVKKINLGQMVNLVGYRSEYKCPILASLPVDNFIACEIFWLVLRKCNTLCMMAV